MFPNLSLVLSLALALSPPAAAAPAGPQAPLAASTSSYCNLTYTVTYYDAFGPIFVENHYACDLPPLSSSSSSSSSASDPIHVSTPYYSSYSRTQKHTIHHYGCAPLPDARHLSRNKYSNLFWGISQLTNMSCLDPGEAVEYVDVNRDWTADWRFTNVNRGAGRVCDWYGEIANVARALHYFCFHALGRPVEEEFSGGEEVLAYGRSEGEGVRVGSVVGEGEEVGGNVVGGGGQWWCMRYSKKGWGLEVFDKWCLGV